MFQGGCYGQGDMVDDTPAEDDSTYGCHISHDTCPMYSGKTPFIYNYMNYSLDCCLYEFTPGQVVHMQDQLRSITIFGLWINPSFLICILRSAGHSTVDCTDL
ncbi:hypothetical protein BDQ17DRAFT_1514065 [Cyathus striatus]|nr:hypothetical protein BDQ17DRAFT_1514065 [Cyathus striatus]